MSNAITLSQYVSPIMLIALAEVPVLILGEIDLSVGEVYVLAPFLVHYAVNWGFPVVVGIALSLVVAAAIGVVNGFITVQLHIPSFITTLGSVFAIEGIILISSNGTQVTPDGSSELAGILGGSPWSEIIWSIAFLIVLHVVLRHTRFGLHNVAVGGNEIAAREAGVHVDFVKVACFVICAVIGGFIGILDGYRIGSLDPSNDGLTVMFYGVAAAVIGGTALTGGRGTMIGAGIGAAVLGILQNGLNIIGVSAYAYDLILGLAILGAMILNVWIQRVQGGSGSGSVGTLLSGRGESSKTADRPPANHEGIQQQQCAVYSNKREESVP
jgi:simple sugar transport system permease protein